MERTAELQVALKGKMEEIERITGTFKIEDNGGVVVESEKAADVRKLIGEAKEIRGLIEAEKDVTELKEWADASPESIAMKAAANAAGVLHAPPGWAPAAPPKSLGQAFVESEEFKALQESGGRTMSSPWEAKGFNIGTGNERKDVYTTLPTGTALPVQFGPVQMDPLVPQQFRTRRVRDLFPVQQTNANLIDYFRVTGFTNAASVVPERTAGAFTLKPHSSLTFSLNQAPIRTIAHYEAAHRNVINDEPQLQGIVNNELLYGLRLTEDAQILSGTGTGEDLLGILNTPGIQTVDGDDATYNPSGTVFQNDADLVRRCATLVILAYYEATGIVMHPYDWEKIELTKDSQNRYVVLQNVAIGAEQRLWRLPVVDTPAIQQGEFLVGAFGLGAQLYDREEANIRIAEQHSDFFLRNAIVVLAEERLGLAVKRPEAFVDAVFRGRGLNP